VDPLVKWLLWKTDEEMEDKIDLRYDEYANCLIIMFIRKTLVPVLNLHGALPHNWLEQWI
jgi:hypothetical protein